MQETITFSAFLAFLYGYLVIKCQNKIILVYIKIDRIEMIKEVVF